jgi:ABC-type multidrug transport system ATPase subunit
MDEPTNHLDIYSRELLEDALNEFTGTILAVSHDRYFIEHIAEEVWGMLDGGIDVFSNLAEYREAERVAGRKKIESKKPDPLEALPEKQLKTAVSSEKPLEMPLWDDREIHLYPLLANLKQYPANKSERRRVVADINKLLREVDSNLSRHQEEKISLEKNFTRVESGEIYHDYADLLQTIEAEELLYLQLMEIAEDIKS